MKLVILIFCLLNAFGIFVLPSSALSCQEPPLSDLPFCNYSLLPEERAADIVSRMTLSEKISQLDNVASAIDHLGVPAYNYGTECLHGVICDTATVFPAPTGLGATFNMDIVHEMAVHISTEARALHAAGKTGLTYWAPNININRDPRWGRNQEVPGEDPFLTSQYTKAFVTGLQTGNDSRCLKTVSTCKHFAAYSLENCCGTSRHRFNAVVNDRDLHETYLPAFEACVKDGKAQSIMCSYNAINGIPACANAAFLQGYLRDNWGFDGYVVSDCGAIADIATQHGWVRTAEEAVGNALKAGCDLDCGSWYGEYMQSTLNEGYADVAHLNTAIGRAYKQRFRLGMFDTNKQCSYADISPSQVDLPETRDLAAEIARQTLVLIKNEKSALPLDKNTIKSVAVIGPSANDSILLLSNYHATPNIIVNPLEQLQKEGITINYAQACSITGDSLDLDGAISAASKSDAILVFVGLNNDVEGESRDRMELVLPGRQKDLIVGLAKAKSKSTPLITVLINGGCVSEPDLYSESDAVLEAFYPGEMGGIAIVDAIFGRYNPGGRLPYTIYDPGFTALSDMRDMSMTDWPGRTYRYLQIASLYEFGHGLSYTTFNVTWTKGDGQLYVFDYSLSDWLAQIQNSWSIDQNIEMKAEITNIGSRKGDYVALAFIEGDGKNAPLKALFGFKRVSLEVGESVEVTFVSKPEQRIIVLSNGQKQSRRGPVQFDICGKKLKLYLHE